MNWIKSVSPPYAFFFFLIRQADSKWILTTQRQLRPNQDFNEWRHQSSRQARESKAAVPPFSCLSTVPVRTQQLLKRLYGERLDCVGTFLFRRVENQSSFAMVSMSMQPSRASRVLCFVGLLTVISSSSAFLVPSPFGIGNTHSIDNVHNFGERYRSNVVALFARRVTNNRGPPTREPRPPMNQEIDSIQVRVTAPTPTGKDEILGIMHRDDALAKAREMGGLDLILVNPNSDPPVCKIVDYSKYRYQQEKKAKEVKKNSKATEIKEVKMSYKIDVHDYDVRKKSAFKFLNQGNRVKCTVMFRGREVQHDQLGFELLDKLAADLDTLCVREGKAKREGKNLSLIISPRPEVLKKVGEIRRAEEKAKKKKRTELKEQRAAAAAAAGMSSEAIANMEFDDDDDDIDDEDDDDIDLESDIESSLDDLFGSDDLTDNLFG